MQWAALVAWLLTASGGLVLFRLWATHGGREQREGIRRPRLTTHAALAVVGLALWVAFLASDESALAWLAVALLVAVALVGFSMLLLSLRGETKTQRTEAPAEANLPLPVVALHGLLGATTLVLAALAAAGIGT